MNTSSKTHKPGVFEENKRNENHQHLLAQAMEEVSALLTQHLSLNEVLERLFDLLGQVVNHDSVSIQLIDSNGHFYLRAGRGFEDFERTQKAVAEVWLEVAGANASLLNTETIPDTRADPHWVVLPGAEHVRSWIGAPLRVREKAIGMLNVDSWTPNSYDAEAAKIVQVFANQAAIAIENARLLEEATAQTQKLRRLYELAATLTGEPQQVFERVVSILADQFSTRYATVEVLRGETLEIVALWRDRTVVTGLNEKYPLHGTPCERVTSIRQPCFFNTNVTEIFPKDAVLRDWNVQAYLGVPAMDSSGQVVGVVTVMDDRARNFGEADVHLLTIFGQRVGMELERAREIEAARRAEQALRESEKRHHAISDIVSDYAYALRIEADGRSILEWETGSLREITGYDRDEFNRQGGLWTIFHPDDVETGRATKRQVLSGQPSEMEVRVVARTGEARWIRGYLKPEWDAGEGRVTRLYGAFRDITKYKQTETALRESEINLRRITDNMQDLIAQTDANFLYEYISPSFKTVLGYEPESLIGRTVFELVHPDEVEAILAAAQTAAREKKNDRAEFRYRHANGHYVWLETYGALLFDQTRTVRGAIFTSRDITERKRAEATLKEAEVRYRTLVEQLPAITYVVGDSPTPQTLYVSPQIQDILGFTPEEWLADPDLWQRQLHPEDRERVLAEDRLSLSEGKFTSEYRILAKDGHTVWLHDETRFVYDEQGQFQYTQGIEYNITERKRFEAALNHRVKLDGLIADISTSFINVTPEQVDNEIVLALQKLCEFTGVNHGFILRLVDQDTAVLTTHEWSGPDSGALFKGRRTPVEQILWFISYLRKLETVHIPRVVDLPPEARASKEILLSQNIQSALRIPISLGGILIGCLGFSTTRSERMWSEEEIIALKLAGEIFVGALQRKEAEEALRESEVRYRLIFDRMIDGFTLDEAVLDEGSGDLIDYRWLDVNPAFERLTELRAADIVGKRALEVLPNLDPEWLAQYGQMMRTGQPVHFEKYVPALDKTFEVTALPTEPGRFATVFIDVTNRKRAEDALHESEARYRSVFESSPVSLWEEDFSEVKRLVDHLRWQGVTDFETYFNQHPDIVIDYIKRIKIVDVNRTTLELFGAADKTELLGSLAKVFGDEDFHISVDELVALAEGRTGFQAETINRTLQGQKLWIYMHWGVASGHEHDFSRVLVSLEDITERKRSDEALRESEARHRTLFENSPISLWEDDLSVLKSRLADLRQEGVMDFESYFSQNPERAPEYLSLIKATNVNQATLELYGAASKEELLGNIGFVFGAEDFRIFARELAAIADGKTEFESESVGFTLQGKKLLIYLRWAVVPGHEHDFSKVLVSIQDITERKRAEALLASANADLELALFRATQLAVAAEEASQLKSQILANTSHELRTPLTAILGSLSVVLEGLCDTETEKLEFINTAYTAARNLLNLINDLLDLAKIESGRMELDLQVVGISSVFSEVEDLASITAQTKRLTLDIRPPADPELVVLADPTKLHQILLNLVGNAIKFTDQGQVTVTASTDNDYVRIDVQDTGIGISPEKQLKLFQPFVQGDGSTTRKYGGTGLGLSISRQLAELMGGALTLHSTGEGQGSTFTLTLPLAEKF